MGLYESLDILEEPSLMFRNHGSHESRSQSHGWGRDALLQWPACIDLDIVVGSFMAGISRRLFAGAADFRRGPPAPRDVTSIGVWRVA